MELGHWGMSLKEMLGLQTLLVCHLLLGPCEGAAFSAPHFCYAVMFFHKAMQQCSQL